MKYSLLTLFALLWLVSPRAQAGEATRLASATRVSVVSENPFQIRIETSDQTAPQTQMIEQPDRLVIDLPNTRPGPTLRRLNVNHAAVRAVRASLYSTEPPITRIVIDLTLPQWYRILPDKSGVLVTIGGGQGAPTDPGDTIGWVSTRSAVQRPTSARTAPSPQAANASLRRPVVVNGASVEFTDGQLTIHANNATLSEVLYQIQKKTGAEIAIPSGTEQEKVVADFGPASPSEVLSQLLNGSGLNFVVVGSETNPKLLRSVLLSRKGTDLSSAAQPYSPPIAENMQMEAPDQNMIAPGPEVLQEQGTAEMGNPPQQNAPDAAGQTPQVDPPNN